MRRSDLRSRIDERQAEKANRNADDAEGYAEGMVAVAAYAVDAAEYAMSTRRSLGRRLTPLRLDLTPRHAQLTAEAI